MANPVSSKPYLLDYFQGYPEIIAFYLEILQYVSLKIKTLKKITTMPLSYINNEK